MNTRCSTTSKRLILGGNLVVIPAGAAMLSLPVAVTGPE